MPIDVERSIGSWGGMLLDLDTQQVLFSRNANALFVPASLTKLFTTAAALKILPSGFHFQTSVWLETDALILKGGGDPTLMASGLCTLAEQVYAQGIRRIQQVDVDESLLQGTHLLPHVEWEDLTWYYAPEVSALSVNENAVSLTVSPGHIALEQEVPYCNLKVDGLCEPSPLKIRRGLQDNTITISGRLPADAPAVVERVAVHRPAEYARQIFIKYLKQAGIQLEDRQAKSVLKQERVQLASLDSPSLPSLIQLANKDSHNLTADVLVRAIGREQNVHAACYLTEGLAAIKRALHSFAIEEHTYSLYEGVGLSRQNFCSSAQVVRLLKHLYESPFADVFIKSLAIGGIDGTLRDRFKASKWQGCIHAKTGTLSHLSNLAGYIFTPAGKKMAFCLCLNHLGSTEEGSNWIEHMLMQWLDP